MHTPIAIQPGDTIQLTLNPIGGSVIGQHRISGRVTLVGDHTYTIAHQSGTIVTPGTPALAQHNSESHLTLVKRVMPLDSELLLILSRPATNERRRHERHHTGFDTTLADINGHGTWRAASVNISAAGLAVADLEATSDHHRPPTTGTRLFVAITHPGCDTIQAIGTVVAQDGEQLSLRFEVIDDNARHELLAITLETSR